MNVEAINTLASLLEAIPPETKQGFNMESYISDVTNNDGEPETVDSNHVEHECNTTACIAGWAASYLKADGKGVRKRARTQNEIWEAQAPSIFPLSCASANLGAAILGLTPQQARALFEPMNWIDYGGRNPEPDFSAVTPQQAALVLRDLAKTGEVHWEVAGEEYEEGDD